MSTRLSKTRVILPLLAALFCGAGYAAPQAQNATERGLSTPADCGVLSVVPIAEGALRVRCAPPSAPEPPNLVLIHQESNVRFSLRRTADFLTLTTSRLTATLNRKTGTLRFSDAKGRV